MVDFDEEEVGAEDEVGELKGATMTDDDDDSDGEDED